MTLQKRDERDIAIDELEIEIEELENKIIEIKSYPLTIVLVHGSLVSRKQQLAKADNKLNKLLNKRGKNESRI